MRRLIVDADFVRRHATAPGYVVVDARAPDFYAGTRAGGSPQRPHKPGHIAGAKSVPFAAVTTADLKLASADEIAARFKAAGVKPGDTVVFMSAGAFDGLPHQFAAHITGSKA